ncbi:MAG: hypothetical protein IE886_07675 [Campylobacterales bacterium]|nr:hypothetical protein [Campylobacterales bacterium]
MPRIVMDANEAVARVAFKTNEVIAIYPITPSPLMGEYSDEYAAKGDTNIFGTVPDVMEMQSEGGASGAVHGALQAGSLTTTFTASQGLLLMIPNMHKIAGELTPTIFHVAARSLAAQALPIFGDHSDMMQCRPTGFVMLASCDAQEAHDFALIAQAASLHSRIPILHFFDGFRTSHELVGVETLDDAVMKVMITPEMAAAHKARALDPEKPVLRGTSQNPDVYFQGRESVNAYYDAFAGILHSRLTVPECNRRSFTVWAATGPSGRSRTCTSPLCPTRSVPGRTCCPSTNSTSPTRSSRMSRRSWRLSKATACPGCGETPLTSNSPPSSSATG